ncbi:iron transport multicopper oxidase FET3 precursor [Chytriomyces sp. MP71]|nr:iron transport multicopper oxidase FET3 precursor [Chytriomyces sp. MP71]
MQGTRILAHVVLLAVSFATAQRQDSSSATSMASATSAAASPAASTSIVTIPGSTGGPEPVFPASVSAAGSVVTLNWELTYVDAVTRFNQTRRMIGVNGKWPIDPVFVNYNDTLVVNVKNSLDKEGSLHFHGLFQHNTPDMDGAPFATQCPIPAGASYTYKFQVQQWGTYWIHAHGKGEYVDGLRAPLVVKPPKGAPQEPFDNEQTVSIADWYREEHPVVLERFLSMYNPAGAEPVPNTALINEIDNASFQMTPGKTTKFRFVSFASLVTYSVYIEGHDMYVVEVDGVDVEPSLQSSFSIAPAQRVSILVKARAPGNGTDVNYNLHAVMQTGMFENAPDDLVSDVTATLVYSSSSSAKMFPADNSTVPDFDMSMVDTDLVPTNVLDVIPNPDPSHSFIMSVSFQVFSDGTNHGTFNNIPFIMPNTPILYSALTLGSDLKANPAAYGPNSQAMVTDFDKPTEIIIVNGDSGIHPFHLHGHAFQIIINTNNTWDPTNVANNYPNPLPTNPVRRDVINVPGGGYAIIRFQSNNPGVWFFHCHIEWHFEAGLAALLVEAPANLPIKSVDPAMQGFCKQLGLSSSGNAAGNQGLDMSGLMVGPSVLVDGITATGWGALVACAISSFIGVATVIWFAKKDEIVEKGESVPTTEQ